MSKYVYIHFSPDVPKNIEREYNKLCRKEHYLEEKDLAHGVIHIDHDSCLNNVPEPRTAEIIKAEITWNLRLEYLSDALVLLKDKFPLEYNLINDYFLSDRNLSMSALAEKYNLSFKQVEYRLKKAKELLKKYIILHENNN
ncbi:MAG: hypothetical protein K2J32_00365 [Ruminococcus sp.]|nr:hypothetical protein [Ruminococcus sp.]